MLIGSNGGPLRLLLCLICLVSRDALCQVERGEEVGSQQRLTTPAPVLLQSSTSPSLATRDPEVEALLAKYGIKRPIEADLQGIPPVRLARHEPDESSTTTTIGTRVDSVTKHEGASTVVENGKTERKADATFAMIVDGAGDGNEQERPPPIEQAPNIPASPSSDDLVAAVESLSHVIDVPPGSNARHRTRFYRDVAELPQDDTPVLSIDTMKTVIPTPVKLEFTDSSKKNSHVVTSTEALTTSLDDTHSPPRGVPIPPEVGSTSEIQNSSTAAAPASARESASSVVAAPKNSGQFESVVDSPSKIPIEPVKYTIAPATTSASSTTSLFDLAASSSGASVQYSSGIGGWEKSGIDSTKVITEEKVVDEEPGIVAYADVGVDSIDEIESGDTVFNEKRLRIRALLYYLPSFPRFLTSALRKHERPLIDALAFLQESIEALASWTFRNIWIGFWQKFVPMLATIIMVNSVKLHNFLVGISNNPDLQVRVSIVTAILMVTLWFVYQTYSFFFGADKATLNLLDAIAVSNREIQTHMKEEVRKIRHTLESIAMEKKKEIATSSAAGAPTKVDAMMMTADPVNSSMMKAMEQSLLSEIDGMNRNLHDALSSAIHGRAHEVLSRIVEISSGAAVGSAVTGAPAVPTTTKAELRKGLSGDNVEGDDVSVGGEGSFADEAPPLMVSPTILLERLALLENMMACLHQEFCTARSEVLKVQTTVNDILRTSISNYIKTTRSEVIMAQSLQETRDLASGVRALTGTDDYNSANQDETVMMSELLGACRRRLVAYPVSAYVESIATQYLRDETLRKFVEVAEQDYDKPLRIAVEGHVCEHLSVENKSDHDNNAALLPPPVDRHYMPAADDDADDSPPRFLLGGDLPSYIQQGQQQQQPPRNIAAAAAGFRGEELDYNDNNKSSTDMQGTHRANKRHSLDFDTGGITTYQPPSAW